MAKVGDQDDSKVPPNQRDFNDDVRLVLNYGKYQPQVLTSPPTYSGRRGEFVFIMAASGTLMVCTTDNAATWRSVASFSL